jgi:glycosyltransferase involved in cell wall biosynthesis
MDDVRWFAPNRFCALVVPRLRELGLAIALEGDRPARLAVAMDAQVAADAYRYAVRHHCLLIHYIWDLPPWRLGDGRPDWVWLVRGRYVRLPRPVGGYRERRGYYSRLRYVAAHAREVWVPSAATARDVRERFGVPCYQVPYCYDSERFVPASRPDPCPTSLLSVSRLVPQKNHAAVIRAAACFDPPLTVRIVGSGPEREALERLAVACGVACVVEGGLDDRAVVQAYWSAGVVVCPSMFEGFGLTPLESIACGTPLVASDIPAHREFLGDVPPYFSPHDDAALVAAIERARVSAPPRRDVLQDLTTAAAARRFLDRLGRLL